MSHQNRFEDGYLRKGNDILEYPAEKKGEMEWWKRHSSLLEKNEFLQVVFKKDNEVKLLVDSESGEILDANTVACLYYGYPKDELLGVNVSEIGLSLKGAGAPDLSNRDSSCKSFQNPDDTFELTTIPLEHEGRKVLFFILCDATSGQCTPEFLRQAAHKVRSIFECAPVGIYQISPEGRFLYANPAAAHLLGYETSEQLLCEVTNITTQLYPDPVRRRNVLEILNNTDQVQDFELELKHRDGRRIWISFDGRTVRDEKRRVLYYEGFMSDITERKHAEEALQKSLMVQEQYRKRLEAIFRSIPDAIITVDKEMHVLATNDAVGDICELALANGEQFGGVAAHRECPCHKALEDILTNQRPIRSYKFTCPQRKEENRVIELNCSPLLDKNEFSSGAVLVLKDITRLADLENKLLERHSFSNIIGKSKRMQEVFSLLEQLADLDTTILVLGESGTGKELIVDALHYRGARREGPLVKVNCAALPENLLESELFGHVRGAFTGAVRDKVGRFQAAEGGTIFLDEVGDISPCLQAKLLRVLEQKEYERLGESKTSKADVRLLAATNADLLKKVEQGLFRQDLYYRLNVMRIELPPLRERVDDIPLLVDHFRRMYSKAFNKHICGVASEVIEAFLHYPWPGNIRELKHAVEHACILCNAEEIALAHLPQELMRCGRSFASKKTGRRATKGLDAEAILTALKETEGNKTRAARLLGIGRVTLYRKVKELSLEGRF